VVEDFEELCTKERIENNECLFQGIVGEDQMIFKSSVDDESTSIC
jgi:hypothetical protein